MKTRDDLTAEYVKSILDYDPETGIFVWKNRPVSHFCDKRSARSWNTRFAGKIAGNTNTLGYLVIAITSKESGRRKYLGHRLAWVLMTGKWPLSQIDHRDGCESNNKWENLRQATGAQNVANTRKHFDNKSGFKGVSWSGVRGRWIATITANGEYYFLGYFDSPEEASVSYDIASEGLHREYRRAA